MKKFLLALLLFSCLALAYSPHPKEVGASKVFIELNWTIDFGDKLPPEFTFTSFAYPTNAWQNARFESAGEHSFVQETDSFGNVLAKFSFQPKKKVEVVSLRALVDVNYAASSTQQTATNYSEQTSLTAVSPEIISKAQQLSAGKSDLEKAVALAEWVHNHVRYDGPGYGATVQSAASTFASAVGTCDEYSHLFSSMARASGLSTKFVAGFVCSTECEKSGNWGAHAWNEVLIDGKWVPFDTTFNEGVLLDATHVKFAEGRDQNDIKEKLSAIAFDFSIKDVQVTRSTVVSLDDWQPFQKFFSVSVSVPSKTFGKEAIVPVEVILSSNTNQELALPININVPKEARVTPLADALVLLQPSTTASRNWNVLLPESLDAGFIYNFTVQAISLGTPAQASITATAQGESQKSFSIKISDVLPTIAEGSLSLKIVLENSGNEPADAAISITTNIGNASQTVSVPAASKKEAFFSFPSSPNTTLVEGSIFVKTSSLEITQPISISLERPAQPTAFLPDVSSISSPLPLAAAAIVIILFLALYLLKQH